MRRAATLAVLLAAVAIAAMLAAYFCRALPLLHDDFRADLRRATVLTVRRSAEPDIVFVKIDLGSLEQAKKGLLDSLASHVEIWPARELMRYRYVIQFSMPNGRVNSYFFTSGRIRERRGPPYWVWLCRPQFYELLGLPESLDMRPVDRDPPIDILALLKAAEVVEVVRPESKGVPTRTAASSSPAARVDLADAEIRRRLISCVRPRPWLYELSGGTAPWDWHVRLIAGERVLAQLIWRKYGPRLGIIWSADQPEPAPAWETCGDFINILRAHLSTVGTNSPSDQRRN
jgi:hypothetical protein